MMQLFKHCVGVLAKPLALSLLLAIAAAVLQFRGRRRIAAWLLVIAAAIIYLGAIGPVSNALLGPLEGQYSPLRDGSLPAVGYVVVLGSGYAPHDGIPVTGALDQDGMVRIVEGVRLMHRLGDMRLVVSGGARDGGTSPALGYAKLARELGIDNRAIVVLDGTLDTGNEARSVAALIGKTPFILVTSSYHMPRAMRLMEHAGARPIPAPTGQLVDPSAPTRWEDFFPSSSAMGKTERALHEYLGIAALAAGVDQ
jgi:uncharacterized SAM-binding protein YcdF (DUF218 family)